MKKTQLLDAFRNIKKQVVSFLSIVIIIAIGTGVFMGCHFSSKALRRKANEIDQLAAYHDLEIRSTGGISEEDVAAVLNTEGVKDAEGIYSLDMIMEGNEQRFQIHVISTTERLDHPNPAEGNPPKSVSECVISKELADRYDLSVGDKVRIYGKTADQNFLKEENYTVSGIVYHPDNFRKDATSIPNVLISPDAVDTEKLMYPYTGIVVQFNTEKDRDVFSKNYLNTIEDKMSDITPVGEEREQKKRTDLVGDADKQIEEGEAELASAKEQLDDAQKEIEDGEAELASAKEQLDDGQKEIEDGEAELASAKEQLDDAQKEIEENDQKLTDAKEQIASAEKEIEDGKKELAENEVKLKDAEKQLKDAKPELDKNEEKLKDARKQLDAAADELDAGYQELMDADATLSSSKAELDKTESYLDTALDALKEAERLLTEGNGKATIVYDGKKFDADWDDYNDLVEAYNHYMDEWNCGMDEYEAAVSEYNAGVAKYEEGSAEYLSKEQEYQDGLKLFNEKKAEYEKGLEDYKNGLKEFKEAEKELSDGEATLEEKKKEFEDGAETLASAKKEFEEKKKEYEDGAETLASAKKEFEEKKKEYEDGVETLTSAKEEFAEKKKEYEDGEKELEDAKKLIEKVPDGRWILMPRTINMSWSELRDLSSTFDLLAYTFALMFILLSILVCYSTLGRIISEQRKLVGTTKALGFKKSEILIKYLIFGISGALLGAAGGILVCIPILEPLIVGSVEKSYTLGEIEGFASALPIVLSFIGSVVVAVLATWIACRKLLAEHATQLMSGDTPTIHKKKAKAGKDSSLYTALIIRNISTDLKRVVITVVSIGGSCMLLFIGFALKQSYDEVIERQFSEIIHYDGYVEFEPDDEDVHVRNMEKAIADAGAESLTVYMTGTMSQHEGRVETIQLTAADPEELADYLILEDTTRKKTPFTVPEEGVVIFQRLAEALDLEIGDTLSIMDGQGVYRDVPISGICTCYAGRMVCMSSSYAKQLFQDEAKENCCLIKYKDAAMTDLKQKLSQIEGFGGFTDVDDLKLLYQQASDLMNLVIIALIIVAGIMAAFIQLNLVKIQMNSKKRELTIMRVNGFTVKEAVGYLVRENALTCVIGILLGLLLGWLASKLVLRILDRVELMMIRDLMGWPFVYSTLITLLFTIIVNWIALRKIKDLKLVDAAS